MFLEIPYIRKTGTLLYNIAREQLLYILDTLLEWMERVIYTKKGEKNPNIQSFHDFASIKVENIIIFSQLSVCAVRLNI